MKETANLRRSLFYCKQFKFVQRILMNEKRGYFLVTSFIEQVDISFLKTRDIQSSTSNCFANQ